MTDRVKSAFIAFHRANPHVYDRLVSLARAVKAKGYPQYSIAGLVEIVRYEHAISGKPELHMANAHRALYSRMIMENEPDLDGFFKLAERRSLRGQND